MDLLPLPATTTAPADTLGQANRLTVAESFTLHTAPELREQAQWWAQISAASLGKHTNIYPEASDAPATTDASTQIHLNQDPSLSPEAYTLDINDDGIRIRAADMAGAHYAFQTLRQLAGPHAFRAACGIGQKNETLTLPHVNIADQPRMSWRGVLLDVARHFMPVANVLRFIDHAAAHKLNRIHLHLTDDQGWRVQIDAYPKLTQIGAWRPNTMHGSWRSPVNDHRPHGGYYTKDDLREIVAYARQRAVTVIPEINLPGHTQAVVAAYPELATHDGTEGTNPGVLTTWGFSPHTIAPTPHAVDFFTTVLGEVLEIFDSPWVCIGGDEVVTSHWHKDARLVQQTAELGLADIDDLQQWFMRQISDFLAQHGRTPVVWDEALREGLMPGTVVLAWRGAAIAERALAAGYDTIMAAEQHLYLDHRAADSPAEPIPVGFARTVRDYAEFDPDPAVLMTSRPDWIRTSKHLQPLAPVPDDSRGNLLGAQAQLWSEHLDSPRRMDYAAYPRLAAFAETVWTPLESRNTADLLARLSGPHTERLQALGIEFRPDAGPHPWQQRPGIQGWYRDFDREGAVAGWVGGAAYFDWHDLDPNQPDPELEAIAAEQPSEESQAAIWIHEDER